MTLITYEQNTERNLGNICRVKEPFFRNYNQKNDSSSINKNFRDKWNSDYKISVITNTKPHAGWRNARDETCLWLELTVSHKELCYM